MSFEHIADRRAAARTRGDGADDVVRTHPASTLRIYVATGR